MTDRKRRRDASPTNSPVPSGSVLPFSPIGSPLSDSNASAVEDNVIEDDIDSIESEDDQGEDLFGSDMEADYRENRRQDRYESEHVDDQVYDSMDPETRRMAERTMYRRDIEEGRLPAAFDDDEDRRYDAFRARGRFFDDVDDMDLEIAEVEIDPVNLNDIKTSSINEWVTSEGPRKAIKTKFRSFLASYKDFNGNPVYGARVKTLCEEQIESLEVSYKHLSDAEPILATFLAKAPAEMLKIFDEVAFKVALRYYPNYGEIHRETHVRIVDLPTFHTLRDLRRTHVNTLVRVSGVVTRRTGVFPQLKYVKFNCAKCGNVMGPFYQDIQNELKISHCVHCESRGPFLLNAEQTYYRNYQKITLQETPGSVPPGRLPRHREVILLWDLIDSVKPGEEIEVTGIYRNNFDAVLNVKSGFPTFATIIEANYISKKDDLFSNFRLSEEDKQKLEALKKDENIGSKIINSIAPSIYGHEDIKRAIALSLFGGVPKNVGGKHRLRGDINVLLLGDPGTAKSQFLKYVEKTAHRVVYTTGQGASAVGLTASVRKDPVTREWTLEGGALVLADKGVCLIDEFDKMNDADRTSIHEAMEQQSISISKAGIVTSLQARCAVIAAANPVRGRYNTSVPFSQNVDLTEPILSRFDVMCVVKDIIDPTTDETLAKFVVNSHMQSHPDCQNSEEQALLQSTDLIDQEILRKYLMYAKEIEPKLHQLDQDKLSQLYSDLRREAGDSIPITVRHLESMLRLTEANARMHLRTHTNSSDVDVAIDVVLQSFFASQKYSVASRLRRTFAKYINRTRNYHEILLHVLNTIVREKVKLVRAERPADAPNRVVINKTELQNRAKNLDIHTIEPFLKSNEFKKNFKEEGNTIVKFFAEA
ncbi:3298_t:CDS:10 [Paraglomus brasilianum]|uniref:DNA replication licensing factor MCM2 n=1 Tax=Paraglomus brasilianum TaxID=144538 RepID=A0A9N8ZB05_9GLOM|nr:3298_t:CDS:10 [Paraglomus brasilianum]